ncbi:SDR family oxidoreductase [Robiginitalea biformata]|uniref:Hypothetical enzyme of sugar metabolism n=1 Tax=Robiginitalea biformata (strain ATCC BAA-864 / DSM 15991 / KCTC 12146 / HTCC2501) TaxID=313596 RepID=A4CH63_ROBBH|nr:SDR family oxidoreductase [Robiginitalea biformata]EAR16271.1 Hypothetical enzyme of sugar metabolism [Robiginitalea biformata HTCC2501]
MSDSPDSARHTLPDAPGTIGILGCGWLGFPLAGRLLESGYSVRGTTTRAEKLDKLENAGIRAFQVVLTETGFTGDWREFLQGLDLLVCNIPPGIRANPQTDYPAKIRHLVRALEDHGVPRLIYIGSTSVYGRSQGVVDEAAEPEPDSESGRQLLRAEEILRASPLAGSSLILRFGGLIGPNRHPVTMLSGRTGLSGGNDPVNLIERTDCLNLIERAIRDPSQVGIANGVAPGHPAKADYYQGEALERGIPPPQYVDSTGQKPGKRIKSRHFLVNTYEFLTTPEA